MGAVCCAGSFFRSSLAAFLYPVHTATAEAADACHEFPRRAFTPRPGQSPAPRRPRENLQLTGPRTPLILSRRGQSLCVFGFCFCFRGSERPWEGLVVGKWESASFFQTLLPFMCPGVQVSVSLCSCFGEGWSDRPGLSRLHPRYLEGVHPLSLQQLPNSNSLTRATASTWSLCS